MTTVLDTPPGYIAAYEGTTKPEVKSDNAEDDTQDRRVKIEDAILLALESEPVMSLRELRRKTHAERYGQWWDSCLKRLEDDGDVVIEKEDVRAMEKSRTWVLTLNRRHWHQCFRDTQGVDE